MARVTKVLYIIDNYNNPFAGTEGQLFKLVSGLDREQFEPHLLLFNASSYINEHGFPCETTVANVSRISSFASWANLFRALKAKKKEGFRIAHIFFNDPSIMAPPLLKILGFKIIISRRDMGYWYTPIYLVLLRINARLIDAAIVNSMAVKEITSEKEWIKPEKVLVIYNGYEFGSESSELVNLRKQDNQIVLGIVANIRPIKRMQDAIEAVAKLISEGLPVRLVIVGGGDPSSLRVKATQLGIEECVSFAGAQSDTDVYIKAFDIALLCSESEGFSNAIIEYMQYGKPVVCSKVGGNPEIIEEGVNGYLYEVGDVGALFNKLKTLCESLALRVRLGESGAEKVHKEFGMSKMLDRHHVMYQQLLR